MRNRKNFSNSFFCQESKQKRNYKPYECEKTENELYNSLASSFLHSITYNDASILLYNLI